MSTGSGPVSNDGSAMGGTGGRYRAAWLLVLMLVITGIIVYSIRRARRPSDAAREHSDVTPSDRYVGDQGCKTCHREIYDQYQRTGMARSWRSIDSVDHEHFGDHPPVRHALSGFAYQSARSSDRLQIVESRAKSSHAAEHQLARDVHFAVGSGTRAQAYVIATNGYLTLAPINWYTNEQKWDLNPGYAEYNHRFDRRVLAECVACHQGRQRPVPGSVYRYEMPMTGGIGCESCHGPGRRHVAEQTGEADGHPAMTDDGDAIVNPGRLEPVRQNDVCFSCHVAADVRWTRAGHGGEAFRPGRRLADFRGDFFVTPDDPDAVGVASHGSRMVRSRCFTESGGRMTCIACHDPHVPASTTPRATYDAACSECHARSDCPQAAPANATDTSCTRCHMPAVPASNAPHVVFTEHWIRSRLASEPTEVRVATRPKRATGQPVELSDFWSNEPTDVDRGIAYVAYFDDTREHRQREDLEHGLKLLAAARTHAAAWSAQADFWLGIGYGHRGDWSRAVQAIDQCVRKTDDPQLVANALARLAQAYEQMGKPDAAASTYRELMRRFPDSLEPYESLLPLLIAQRQFDDAITLAQSSLERNGDQPVVLARLALALIRRDRRFEGPLERLAAAQRLNPDLPLIYLTRAAVLESAGDTRGAQAAQRDALCAMARAALTAGDRKAAARFVENALKLAPNDAGLNEWLDELTQTPGIAVPSAQ